MEQLNQLLNTELATDVTLRDIIEPGFLLGVVGNIVLAAVIVIVGFFLAGWLKRRIHRIFERSERLDKTTGSFLGSLAR